jgi:hypothetical protein
MSENRRKILEMLTQGKITLDQADELLETLPGVNGETTGAGTDQPFAASPLDPKYIRVEVREAGQEKVNIRIPFKLLRAGIKLPALLPKNLQEKVNEALHTQGVKIPLADIKTENIEEFIRQLADISVDVSVDGADKNNRVRLYCE